MVSPRAISRAGTTMRTPVCGKGRKAISRAADEEEVCAFMAYAPARREVVCSISSAAVMTLEFIS